MALLTQKILDSGILSQYVKLTGIKLYQHGSTFMIEYYKDEETRNANGAPIQPERISLQLSEEDNGVLFWVLYRFLKRNFENATDHITQEQSQNIENIVKLFTDEELAWAPTVLQNEVERRNA